MNKFFQSVLMIALSVGLAACQSSAIPQVTVTPQATHTSSPMPTQTHTPQPTLPAEVVENSKEWQERLGDLYEIKPDGSVWDKTTGYQIPGVDWQKGTWTYEFDGNPNFTQSITANDLSVVKDVDGVPTGDLNFLHLGWKWDGKRMVRKEFQGEQVFSLDEFNTFMANPANVDLTRRDLIVDPSNPDPAIISYVQPGPQIVYQDLEVSVNRYGLAENIVVFPDGQGGWKIVETTTFNMNEMKAYPYTVVRFRDHGGNLTVMIIDRNDIVPDKGPGADEWKHPTGLSDYYVNHTVNLQY